MSRQGMWSLQLPSFRLTRSYNADRATTERHAKILRELVKQPDNKICADCKKNGKHSEFKLPATVFRNTILQMRDGPRGTCESARHTLPRCIDIWIALCSGCFVCIRCSGIHRSMGTHISRGMPSSKVLICQLMYRHIKSNPLILISGHLIKLRYVLELYARSRVYDLNATSPVQHVKKWGNRRANIYWEAHLKPGHIPPDQ